MDRVDAYPKTEVTSRPYAHAHTQRHSDAHAHTQRHSDAHAHTQQPAPHPHKRWQRKAFNSAFSIPAQQPDFTAPLDIPLKNIFIKAYMAKDILGAWEALIPLRSVVQWGSFRDVQHLIRQLQIFNSIYNDPPFTDAQRTQAIQSYVLCRARDANNPMYDVNAWRRTSVQGGHRERGVVEDQCHHCHGCLVDLFRWWLCKPPRNSFILRDAHHSL